MAISPATGIRDHTLYYSSFQQRRERRTQFRKIMMWGILSLISVVAVIVLFLIGTVAAATGEEQTKCYLYIAGLVTLFFLLVPFSNFICCILIKYNSEWDNCGRPFINQLQSNPTFFPSQDIGNCEYQLIPRYRQINTQNFVVESSGSSTNTSSAPPSYELAIRMTRNRERNLTFTQQTSVSATSTNFAEQSRTVSRSLGQYSRRECEDTRL